MMRGEYSALYIIKLGPDALKSSREQEEPVMTIRSPFLSRGTSVRAYYRRSLIVAIALVLFGSPVFIASAQKKRPRKTNKRPSIPTQNKKVVDRRERERERPGENEAIAEDVEGRENWFWRQRMYPFDELPPNARDNAWASRPVDKNRRPDVLTWQPLGPVSTTHRFVAQW